MELRAVFHDCSLTLSGYLTLCPTAEPSVCANGEKASCCLRRRPRVLRPSGFCYLASPAQSSHREEGTWHYCAFACHPSPPAGSLARTVMGNPLEVTVSSSLLILILLS